MEATKTITHIAPGSVGKILAAFYGVIGLIMGGVFASMILVGGLLSLEGFEPALSIVLAVFALVFFPLLYGVMGYVAGIIAAFLYNVLAKRVGGVVLTLK